MKQKDRDSLVYWEEYRKSLEKATSIDITEDVISKKKRVDYLLNDWEAFAKYYFPNYCSAEFAIFHKRFAKKLIHQNRLVITRAWSRDHAKSVMAGIIMPIYLKCSGQLKNMLLVSYSEDNAVELLRPLQIQLESNHRLINDFGMQKGIANWEMGRFVTIDGCSFRAIGTGQNPRGTRNEEARPDFVLCDDTDEDEMCRNPKRLDNAHDWIWGALFGCLSIEGSKRFIMVGNIIAKDTLVKRAIEKSDDHEQIDILDKFGQPSWKERFTLEECQYMIGKMGYRLSQREYFNNPISEGKVFKKAWFQFKSLPPLKNYKYLVAYLDGGFKKTATSDSKALVLVGLYEGKFHIRKVFCGQASIEEMVGWGYSMHEFVKSKSATYRFKMEEVFLMDLLYKDFSAVAKVRGFPLPVSGDKRKKPDKDARIEALSGYFERGDVYFDENIENDHHTKEFTEQFLNFEPGIKSKKDGPDACEGAFHELSSSLMLSADIGVFNRATNKKRA